MAQSLSRGSTRACLLVHTTEVLAPDRLQDLADALASMKQIVAARQLGQNHDHLLNAPTLHERGCLPLLRAGAPHQEAVARITAQ
jgi:hypothetical protein